MFVRLNQVDPKQKGFVVDLGRNSELGPCGVAHKLKPDGEPTEGLSEAPLRITEHGFLLNLWPWRNFLLAVLLQRLSNREQPWPRPSFYPFWAFLKVGTGAFWIRLHNETSLRCRIWRTWAVAILFGKRFVDRWPRRRDLKHVERGPESCLVIV